MTISTNQFKNGTHIEIDGKIWKIIEFQHVKPGKGGAFVRTKLRRIEDLVVVTDDGCEVLTHFPKELVTVR